MLILVSTLVSLLHPVLSALSGSVQWHGLEHWFFLLGLRLLAMYFASSSWENARQDIACAWGPGQEADTRTFCTSACYNRHFLDPVSPSWCFSFLIALFPITIMRMLYPKGQGEGAGGQEAPAVAQPNRASGRRLAVEPDKPGGPKMGGEPPTGTKSNMAATVQPAAGSSTAAVPTPVGASPEAPSADMDGLSAVAGPLVGPHLTTQPPWHTGIFIVCIAALLATETGFLWALLARQLPLMSGPSFRCVPGTPACPPALECAVRGQADKHMALVILALTACISILVCLGYGAACLGWATCCRGRREGERAPERRCVREGSVRWARWGEGEMLIIVSTLVSLLHPVLSAMSGALRWQGLEHWFFLLGLRLLAMYFASAPWESARDDLACAWNRSQEAETQRFCTSVCYNRHFLEPVTATWGFSFLIALLPVTVMRMLYPPEESQGNGGAEAATSARPVTDASRAAAPEPAGVTNVSPTGRAAGLSGGAGRLGPDVAAQPPWHASVITVCIAALLATEAGFLWALLAQQLFMASTGPSFRCFPGTPACPPAIECAIWGQADKRMALGSLALTACVSILVCLGSGGTWLGRPLDLPTRPPGEAVSVLPTGRDLVAIWICK
ncbi:uncharacterized protein LOC142825361 [Pelodiscus sinensis]|uniref:uncharacterized protein LOC142825361 n=1 Tax=Pelodiscus sinensis TaxID=13735 RepID=UPI003F6D945D